MQSNAGQRAADAIGGLFAQAQQVIGEQVGTLAQQLDTSAAAADELRRRLAVERAKNDAVSAALARIVEVDMTQPGSVRPAVTALRGRLLHLEVDGNGKPTTPKLVREFIAGGHALPYWSVDTITGQRVRLADGRRGIVHGAFGTDDTVDLITVEPWNVEANRPGDLVFDLSPFDVEFIDHR